MDRVQPAVADVVLGGLPGDPPPFGRVFRHRAVGAGHPDHLGTGLDQRAVTLLAAPDLLLGRGPGARQHQPHAGDPAVRVGYGEPGRGVPLGIPGLGDREAAGQHLARRGFGPGRQLLRPDLRRELVGVVGLGLAHDLAQRRVHPAETQVRTEKRQADGRLVDQGVHQSGVGHISLPRHRSLRAHTEHLRTAPGAAMGGSFPGIIVHAANQLSVPQSGNWCGLESGFADSERRLPCTSSVSACRVPFMRRNYSGHDTVA